MEWGSAVTPITCRLIPRLSHRRDRTARNLLSGGSGRSVSTVGGPAVRQVTDR